MTRLTALFAGGTGRLDPEGHLSGIFKRPVTGRIAVSRLGLEGDEHADPRVHGGPEKAVHQYAVDAYRRLAECFPACADQLVVGSLGENLSAPDMDEHSVHIGDLYRMGSVLLQVSQPRSPCWKIDHRFGAERMAAHIAQQRITGWYYRVVEPGFIEAGDEVVLLDRVSDRFSIDEFWAVHSAHRPSIADLQSLADTPGLAESRRTRLRERIDWLAKQRPAGEGADPG